MSRRGSHASSRDEGEFVLECKAAYLSIVDDITENITSKERLSMVLQQTGRNPTSKSLNRYWSRDTRSVCFDDFVDICRKEPVTTREDLLKAFRKIDINGDGYLSLDELYKLMTTKGEKMSVEEVRRMIDEVDENKDGRLDYGEFCNMVISTADDCRRLASKFLDKKGRLKKKSSSISSKRENSTLGSQTSLKSVDRASLGRRSVSGSYHEDESPRPAARIRSRPSSGHSCTLPEPSNLKQWHHISSKGCFFIEEGSIISHQYILTLTEKSSVWITIQPNKSGQYVSYSRADGLIDTALYILRKRPDRDGRTLVAFTEHKDHRGKYGVQCDLPAGSYQLVPFTTGCHFKPRRNESKEGTKLIKQEGDKITITKAFRKALEDIFDLCDLDGNNGMSREEFNWFNLRTSGEMVADEEWSVVEEKIDLVDGEITKKGFIQLNELEAEDSEGDTEDLWVTLNCMGFNGELVLDEACPFVSTIDKGSATKIKGMKDLTMYTYTGASRGTIILENKSRSSVRVRLDCSGSRNCISHRGALNSVVEVPAQRTVVGHHMLPSDDSNDFHIKCTETILK
ncbi:hypothetical protein ScPMuIL_005948 [Solemya velum]